MAELTVSKQVSSHIFVSYARADGSEFARKLHDQLEAVKINAWLDIVDIGKGDDFNSSIDHALITAWAVTVVLTTGSVLSKQVQSEWMYALDHHIPVIPLYVLPCNVPRLLNVLNYIDFTGEFDTSFQDLVLRIQELGATHRAYLVDEISQFQIATDSAGDPKAFMGKINAIEIALKAWEDKLPPFPVSTIRVQGEIPSVDVSLFLDRTYFRQRLYELLNTPATRLISILGRGGIGKTALVRKVLLEIEQNQWPTDSEGKPIKGIVYLSERTSGINLERIFTNSAILIGGENGKRLQKTWSNPYMRDEEKITQLLDALNDGTYIILLDNIEDILTQSGEFRSASLGLFFEVALRMARGVRLLATSRIPIALPPGVSLYDERVNLSEGLTIDDSISMLRLMDPHREYGVGDQPDEMLHQVAEITHGVPRALELVISIMANARKEDLFADLSSIIINRFYGQDDVVHKLAQDAYKHLDEDERRIIEVLSVFKRPVPVNAVSQVISGLGFDIAVNRILRELLRSYTISTNPASHTISLHPIDADLAYSEIPLSGNYHLQRIHHLAADYYSIMRTNPSTWHSSDDIEPQLAEFDHLIRAEAFDLAAQLVDEIQQYLDIWENYRLTISLRLALVDSIADSELKKQNLRKLGRAYLAMQQHKEVVTTYQHLLGMLDESDSPAFRAEILATIGWSSRGLSNLDDTLHYLNRAMQVQAELSPSLLGEIYHNYGIAYRNLGDVGKSRSFHQQEFDLCKEVGLMDGVARATLSLGILSSEIHEYKAAEEYYHIALNAAKASGKRQLLCASMGNLGKLQQSYGMFAAATDSFQNAVKYAREINDQRYEAIWLDSLGGIAYALGRYDEAAAYHDESLYIARKTGALRTIAFAMAGLGKAKNALAPGTDEPLRLLLDAHTTAKETKFIRDQQAWGISIAEIYLKTGRFQDAFEMCKQIHGFINPEFQYYAKTIYGVALLTTQSAQINQVTDVFEEAITLSNEMINHSPQHFLTHYVQGIAYAGLALTKDSNQLTSYASLSHSAFTQALSQPRAVGILKDMRQLLSVLTQYDHMHKLKEVSILLAT